ncbi:4736_t:CDS:1, partial [Gigaspora rosea]
TKFIPIPLKYGAKNGKVSSTKHAVKQIPGKQQKSQKYDTKTMTPRQQYKTTTPK